MAKIREEHSAGMPMGCYDVRYYVLRGNTIYLEAGCDSNISENVVEHAGKSLKANEMLSAWCNSSPGGVTIYGSAKVREAFREYRAYVDAKQAEAGQASIATVRSLRVFEDA
jgi:hypothetical protein